MRRSAALTAALMCGGALLLLAGPAAAATLKVGRGKPYETITAAVAAASDGDRIVVYRGRYAESVTVAGRAGLELRARRGVEWLPETWGGPCLTLSQGADRTRVQGFTFRTTGTAVALEGVNDIAVLRCRFRGVDYAVDGVSDGALIARCDVRRVGSALRITGAGLTVERCTFVALVRDGIEIVGDDARLVRNAVRIVMDGAGVLVRGRRALIDRNLLHVPQGHGIAVYGDDAVVTRNDVSLPSDDGIHVEGARARVERNTVSAPGDDGISVVGGGFTVARNRVDDTNDGTAAIVVDAQAGPGDALLTGNVVNESSVAGIEIRGAGVRSSGNRVTVCGDRGFVVRGADHVLERDVVVDAGWTGFQVAAAGTRLLLCTARDVVEDGFRIAMPAVVLENCAARECGAQGLNVDAAASVTISGCTFHDNRQDVAAWEGGTIEDGGGNRWDTGGSDAVPVNR